MSKKILVFIHGIGDGFGALSYEDMLKQMKDVQYDVDDAVICKVDWDSTTSPGENEIFTAAFGAVEPKDNALVSGSIVRNLKALFDWRSWRYFSTFFVGDVIAYTDQNDNGIRKKVWQDMRPYLLTDEKIEFTIIGHSLGSVIAYDFVYALMLKNALFDFEGVVQPEAQHILKLQSSFRNLITFGSPIALFLMRHKELWANEFATLRNPVTTEDGIARKWLNFYDKDDLVAYPLAQIFATAGGVTPSDIEVDTGKTMPWAHTTYWSNDKVAERIAEVIELPKLKARIT